MGVRTESWLWRVAETLIVIGMVVFAFVPSSVEHAFIRELYRNQPLLCIALLTAVGVFVIAIAVHGAQERRSKKVEKAEAVSYRGTL